MRRRKIDEGVAVAIQATVAAADRDSGRVTQGVREIARSLTPFRAGPGVGEFLRRPL